MQPTPRDSERHHFAVRISEADAPMRRIGALASLGVMATAIGVLVLADGEAGEPSHPAPVAPAAYDKDFDSDHSHTPLPLERTNREGDTSMQRVPSNRTGLSRSHP